MSFKIAFIGAGSLALIRTILKRQENYVREIWTQTIFQSELKQQPIVVTPSKMHVILLTVCVSVGLKDLKQM